MRAVMTILVAFSLLPLNTSYADNFVINSGTWFHEALTPNNLLAFTATSTSGNVLVGRAFDDGGLTTPQGILPNGRPFSFSTPLQPGTGSFTLAGQTFQVGGSDGGSYNFLLSGTAVAPPSPHSHSQQQLMALLLWQVPCHYAPTCRARIRLRTPLPAQGLPA